MVLEGNPDPLDLQLMKNMIYVWYGLDRVLFPTSPYGLPN